MRSDAWQAPHHLRVALALAVVLATSTLLAAASPAPQTAAMDASWALASMEPMTPSVMPIAEPTPPSGSAEPDGVAVHNGNRGARAAVSRAIEHVKVSAQRLARPPMSAENLCLTPSSNPDCEAAFNAALRSELERADVVVTAHGSAEVVGPRGAQPLHFQKHAPWVRRLETIGKEGIPFVRIPHGPDREVVVGINRKGLLGFSVRQKSEN